MTAPRWLRRRLERRRRRREAKALAATPLREFVYLDEVSVYSLIASRTGAIETDYRDTNSTLLRSELQGSVGASAGVVKSDVSSAIETSQTSEVQVVRKAIIQSTFRQLYDAERHRLALSTGDAGRTAAGPKSVDELRVAIRDRDHEGTAIVDPDELRRGQVIELEVELQAHQVFGLSTAVVAMMEIIDSASELSSMINRDEVRRVLEINQMLRRLLVGLVPLEGRAVDYWCVTVDGKEWLVRDWLVAAVPDGELEMHEVVVTGVAEQQLFWKDLRRILFSRSRYLVMARLARGGLQDAWNPVKSLTVLEQMAPQVAEPLREGIESLPMIMRSTDEDSSDPSAVESNQFYMVLVRYAVALVATGGDEYPDAAEELVSSGAIDLTSVVAPGGPESRRDAFAAVERHVNERFGVAADASFAAELRERLQREASLWPPVETGMALRARNDGEEDSVPAGETHANRPRSRYLDAEIVAVYW